jgi:hypothetical protein
MLTNREQQCGFNVRAAKRPPKSLILKMCGHLGIINWFCLNYELLFGLD